MRRSWATLVLCVGALGSAASCKATLADGIAACVVDNDCPTGFVCRPEPASTETYCYGKGAAPPNSTDAPADSGMPDAALPSCTADLVAGEPCLPRNATSCARAPLECGAQSCCATAAVAPGEFHRSYDESMDPSQDGVPVNGWEPRLGTAVAVDAFALDRFEVTVARFRAFVADYDAWILSNPVPGAGGGAPGTEWKASFRSDWEIPRSARELTDDIDACPDSAWLDDSQGSDMSTLPMNCITWYEAYLFCLWDGGRLPTEAEWNYAAAGGDQQRPFPWSAAPFVDTGGARSRAVISPGSGALSVGSFPEGSGRWGQLDLAGNVWEWVFDANDQVSTNFTPAAYADCGQSTKQGCVVVEGPSRIFRGGSFKFGAAQARTAYRSGTIPATRYSDLGLRCARDL